MKKKKVMKDRREVNKAVEKNKNRTSSSRFSDPDMERMYKEWESRKSKEEMDAAMQDMKEKSARMGEIREGFRKSLTNGGKPHDIDTNKARQEAEKKAKKAARESKREKYEKITLQIQEYCRRNNLDAKNVRQEKINGKEVVIIRWKNDETGRIMKREVPIEEIEKIDIENEKEQ